MDNVDQVPMERLPEDYEWFKEQIAGHHQSIVKNGERQIGFLKEKTGDVILKLVQEGVRGESEVQVYTRLAALRNQSTVEDDNDAAVDAENNARNTETEILIRQLAPLVPEFYGICTVQVGSKEREFMKLEDITMHFRQPCIMDIKMGKVTFDPLASEQKATREQSKYPEQKKLGFRILGYRLHQESKDVKVADKKWGLSWTAENIDEAFNDYLQLTEHRREEVLTIFNSKLAQIHDWFSQQRIYHFYASSLLFIYDSDPRAEGPLADIRMIDFSHIFPACKSTDQNYMFGLNRVREIFKRL